MKKNPEQEIREALSMTGLVTPVSSSSKAGRAEFLCRIVPGKDADWLLMVEKLLQQRTGVLFIARQYLLKDNKLVFGWFIEVQCDSVAKLKEEVPYLVTALGRPGRIVKTKADPKKAPPRKQPVTGPSPLKVVSSSTDSEGNRIEITEMPIPHVGKDLNTPSKPVWSAEHGRFIGGGRGATYTGRQ